MVFLYPLFGAEKHLIRWGEDDQKTMLLVNTWFPAWGDAMNGKSGGEKMIKMYEDDRGEELEVGGI